MSLGPAGHSHPALQAPLSVQLLRRHPALPGQQLSHLPFAYVWGKGPMEEVSPPLLTNSPDRPKGGSPFRCTAEATRRVAVLQRSDPLSPAMPRPVGASATKQPKDVSTFSRSLPCAAADPGSEEEAGCLVATLLQPRLGPDSGSGGAVGEPEPRQGPPPPRVHTSPNFSWSAGRLWSLSGSRESGRRLRKALSLRRQKPLPT